MKLFLTTSILHLLAFATTQQPTTATPLAFFDEPHHDHDLADNDTMNRNLDDAPRRLNPVSDINVNNDPGVCGAMVDFALDAGSTSVPVSGSLFSVGTTAVDVTMQDGSTLSFDVTVVDNEAPQLTVQDATFELGADGTVFKDIFGFVLVSSTDTCGIVGIGATGPRSFTCNEIGSGSFHVFQNDVNGNEVEATYVCTVTDPLGVCPTPAPSSAPTPAPSASPTPAPSTSPNLRPSTSHSHSSTECC
jgi:hypothetical protein